MILIYIGVIYVYNYIYIYKWFYDIRCVTSLSLFKRKLYVHFTSL